MTWLVTGGAGYIGAHVVRSFQEAGVPVVVLDDLSSGFDGFVPEGVVIVRGSILDGELVERTLREHAVVGVVHVAGYKYAGVSVQRPLHTYEQNVTGTAVLLAAMERAGVDKIVFSSSAAVFGTPDTDLVVEGTPKSPESPYGESKLIGEWLLRDQGVATGLQHTSLRYFNVVGSGDPGVYDASPHNLFPLVFDALLAGRTPASTATTTRRRTAPACATTSTSPTWRARTSRRRVASRPASPSSRPTTSAAATASPCARS
ncbi:hypothetical protein GCM10025874_12440 [Arenivirga flava]|uniref:UDP-glucose 4-epimerase n=1 Tax=Arenivirga flava TaxID=1930060 RepID=A0AA37XB36_9MICO|nr:hypothetical protein GCM10025874_12440 [Arenivirga flava]